MKKIIVLMIILAINVFAIDTQALLKAHKEALKVYQSKDKNISKSLELLKKAGVKDILQKQPNAMSKGEYVQLLNDYAFFIIESKEDNKNTISILNKVIELSPNRTVAYLNLGDVYLNSFEKNKNQKDREKYIKAYKKYIELLRKKDPVPKVPFHVAEEVYLKTKVATPYPDVWGYDFGYQVFNHDGEKNYDPNNINIYKLKNGDIAINEQLNIILYFGKVKFWLRDHLEFKKQYTHIKPNGVLMKLPKLFDKLHKLVDEEKYIFKDTPIVLENGSKLMYHKNCYGIYFDSKFVITNDKVSSTYSFVYKTKEDNLYRYTRLYEDSTESGKVYSDIWSISGCVNYFIELSDGTFVIALGQTAIRFDSDFNTKAPFFNKTVYRLNAKDRKEVYKLPFTPQDRLNKISEIIHKKIKEGK